jgi:regulator of sigma E protease
VRRGGSHEEQEDLLRWRMLAQTKIDLNDPIKIDDDLKAWTLIHTVLQELPPDTEYKLTYSRQGKAHSASLSTRESPSYFMHARGVDFYANIVTHRADTWGEAFQLGGRELGERLKEVLTILRSLVTGNISPTNLMGPAGIVAIAGSVSQQGLPMLLLFLTMLSANLAILNFLPIPALDGGHMLFLTAEAIRGKPVDERLQIRLTILGVLCLLSLMIFATAMDIGRFATMVQRWFG